MNNTIKQNTAYSALKIIAKAQPLLDELLYSLHSNIIPSDQSMVELQSVLAEYITELEYNKRIEEQFGKYTFQDHSSWGCTNNMIINDLSKYQNEADILFDIAIKKLISQDDEVLFQDATQWLIQQGYLAPVEFKTSNNSGKYYTITSKGYLCFTEKRVLQKIKKDGIFCSVPTGLRVAPEAWSVFSMYQAIMLKNYYDQMGIADYILFAAPNCSDVLLGCEVSATPEVCYSTVWMNDFVLQDSWQKYVQETVEAQSVSQITIVYSLKENEKSIMSFVSGLAGKSKIHLFCTEAG